VGYLAWGLLLFAAGTGVASAKERKVLYIGIDGCRFDAIEAAQTPHLDRLRSEGCYDPDCQILGERYQKNDTISGPGWSSILTGVWADKHGVHNNTFLGKKYQHFPHFFARLKEARPDAVTVSAVTWVPIQDHIVSAADQALKFDPPEGDYVPADAEAAATVSQILSNENPTVVFFYIGQVDETGHKHGFHPSVREYVASIEQADKHVGEVLEALRARPTYDDEDWLVVVTSDHGGKGTGHSGGHQVPEIRNSFLIVSGPAAQSGRLEEETYLVDAPATVLKYLGADLQEEWKLDGRPVGLK
jgi:predicted AlkP superfamily pyrophosphatase or phosphodiesterase